MTLFKNKLLPLLLALCMIVTMLPMTALAAEIPEETTAVCTDESCTHDHTNEIPASDDISKPASIEESPMVEELIEAETPEAPTPVDTPAVTEVTSETPEVDELPTVETPAPENPEAPEVPTETNAYSGYIGDSAVSWTFNAETGRLFISGSGYVELFSSEDDQPWRELREQIASVRFDLAASMEITDLCYWFDGCINLSDAAIPVNVCQLCPEDFAVCPALNTLTYGGVDVLVEITMDYSNQTAAYSEQGDADGGISLFSSSNCGVTRCTCTGSCSYGYRNYRVAPESNNYHIMTVYCATCGMTDGIIVSGNHSYSSNGYCSLCGYYNSAYDTSVCYHTSTYTTWSGCNWTRYCSNCGAYISSGTSHGSTYSNISSFIECATFEFYRNNHGRTAEFSSRRAVPVKADRKPKTVAGGYCDSAEYEKGEITDCIKIIGVYGELGDCRHCPYFMDGKSGAYLVMPDVSERKKQVDQDSEFLIQTIESVRRGIGLEEDLKTAMLRLSQSGALYRQSLIKKMEDEESGKTQKNDR